ncbi:hypothetical protein WMY93_014716 [Mugilogobius chulae]|uniref:Uncharacterized protein n=1 Tax=Mugilogobius chulae TaxID=88201 RepID=A0AAW0P782_9GOBI
MLVALCTTFWSGTHQSEFRCLVVTVVNEPRFLPTTPADDTYLHVSVNQTLVIPVYVETPTSFYDLLVFGPENMTNSTLGNGHFELRWTPSEADMGKNITVSFFVIFANFLFSENPLNNYYQSEFRSVTVTVRNDTVSAMPTSSAFVQTKILSVTSLSDEYIQSNVLKQLKEKLENQGLTPQITLRLVSSKKKSQIPPKWKKSSFSIYKSTTQTEPER